MKFNFNFLLRGIGNDCIRPSLIVKTRLSFYGHEISRYQELIRCIMNAKICNKDKKGMQIPDYLVFIKSVES